MEPNVREINTHHRNDLLAHLVCTKFALYHHGGRALCDLWKIRRSIPNQIRWKRQGYTWDSLCHLWGKSQILQQTILFVWFDPWCILLITTFSLFVFCAFVCLFACFFFQDIYDAKAAVDHLSGFNVGGRYLIVLYYQPAKFESKANAAEKEKELIELRKRVQQHKKQLGK